MSVNWDNVERVMDRIDGDPSRFDMLYYSQDKPCGTAMCIAGWAAHLAGWRLEHKAPMAERGQIGTDNYQYRKVIEVAMEFMGLEGEPMDVYDRLFSPHTFRDITRGNPTTDMIRARIKEFDS